MAEKGKTYDEAQVLEECLEMLDTGASLEECLAHYPEGGERLRELLLTARHIDRVSKSISTEGVKQRVWERLSSELSRKQLGTTRIKDKNAGLVWHWRWALTALGLVVVLIGGIVPASAKSLPGELLYAVKVATEEVRSTFTFTDDGKLVLAAELANRRIDEMAQLAARGDREGLEAASARLTEHLDLMCDTAAKINPAVGLSSPGYSEGNLVEKQTVTVTSPGIRTTLSQATPTTTLTSTLVGPPTTGGVPEQVASVSQGLYYRLEGYAESGKKALQEASVAAPEDAAPILAKSLNLLETTYDVVFRVLAD